MTPDSPGELVLADISHGYGGRRTGRAVEAVHFAIPQGEFWTVLGPSGSGKSTLLRIIGGYIRPDQGRVLLSGRDITTVPPRFRDMGMVFQDYALFPHMTVFDNVAYGLRARHLRRADIRSRVGKILELNRLVGLEDRLPNQLSGGQQQRVALARALIVEPTVLLMDEPMGALDLKLREAMAIEVRNIQRTLAITTVHVTHDQSEAMTMSDRVVILRAGRVEQIGTPLDLADRPANRFVAEFVGANVLPVTIVWRSGDTVNGTIAGTDGEKTLCSASRADVSSSKPCLVIRPEEIMLSAAKQSSSLPGVVRATKYFGTTRGLVIEIRSGAVLSALDPTALFVAGEEVHVGWHVERARLVPDSDAAKTPAAGVSP